MKDAIALVLQAHLPRLAPIVGAGEVDAVRAKVAAADEELLSLSVGSWHHELEALLGDVATAFGPHKVGYLAMARSLGLKLPELKAMEASVKAVQKAWKERPGALR